MQHSFKATFENVSIKPLDRNEIDNLRLWRNDPENTAYLRKIPYINREMQEKWFSSYLKNDDELMFSIYETVTLNRMVGSLSLYDFEDHTCFFGKILVGDKEAHGKKIGKKATICGLDVAFRLLKMNKVYLYVFKENIPAVKAYEGAGFTVVDIHNGFNGIVEYTMVMDKGKWEGTSYAQHEQGSNA